MLIYFKIIFWFMGQYTWRKCTNLFLTNLIQINKENKTKVVNKYEAKVVIRSEYLKVKKSHTSP